MTMPRQRATFHRGTFRLTVHDVDPAGQPVGTPILDTAATTDLDAALAVATYVRAGQWQRTDVADLTADVVPA